MVTSKIPSFCPQIVAEAASTSPSPSTARPVSASPPPLVWLTVCVSVPPAVRAVDVPPHLLPIIAKIKKFQRLSRGEISIPHLLNFLLGRRASWKPPSTPRKFFSSKYLCSLQICLCLLQQIHTRLCLICAHCSANVFCFGHNFGRCGCDVFEGSKQQMFTL